VHCCLVIPITSSTLSPSLSSSRCIAAWLI
jgi:hypothetical protein